ncbi:uncharacterized protein LOC108154984 isoform X2 [Drosophila miranda]|nr:uncharacterized protein LOC108154984 isoform X2 [Drosophila miranda]
MQAHENRNDRHSNDITLADWEKVPKVQKKKRSKLLSIDEKNDIMANQKSDMPMPSTTGPCSGLMLPPWRHCKMGPTAILKEVQAPPEIATAPRSSGATFQGYYSVKGVPRFPAAKALPMGAFNFR